LNHPLATVEVVNAVQPQLEYTYSATISSRFGSTGNVISTFRSEQEFGLSRDIYEQIVYFDVLLTVHVSIILVINQLDAQIIKQEFVHQVG